MGRVERATHMKNTRVSDNDLSISVDSVNLKPILGKIKPDRGNLHNGRLLSFVAFSDDHVMAHQCQGAAAVHPIKIVRLQARH